MCIRKNEKESKRKKSLLFMSLSVPIGPDPTPPPLRQVKEGQTVELPKKGQSKIIFVSFRPSLIPFFLCNPRLPK